MSASFEMDRRSFLELLGGGIIVAVTLSSDDLLGQDRGYPTDVNAYLRIGEDGRVTVFSGKIEMGQGVLTSLAQMLAEELGVALGSVDMVMGDTDRCPWDRGTFGSMTTRNFGPALRAAGAEARAILLQLASEHLGTPKEALAVANGVVSLKSAAGAAKRQVTYAQLAKGQKITRTLDQKAVLRSVAELTVMGQSPLRLDGQDKVKGAAQYAGDIRLPGMLHAKLLRPPAHGAKLVSADPSEAGKVSGVTVVHEGDLVAVLHADPEIATAALARIKAEWTPAPPGADQDGIFDELVAKAPSAVVRETKGSPEAPLPEGMRRFEHTYQKGYVAHAAIEPHTATASFENGKLTVWASTQTPFPLHDRLVPMLGLDPKDVRVITPFVGGGFGGKSATRQAEEAARLAKITGKPVQVAFTRAEELFFDTFDPASVVTIVSAIDGGGKMTLWDYHVFFAGNRAAELFYDVPNVRMRVSGGWSGGGSSVHRFGVGPWRAPGANMNVFARESQIDIMAAAAGIDPVEFRLRNTSDERARRCLQEAGRRFGWTRGPSGRGWGVACSVDSGTYVALMAQVKVDRERGHVTVERVVCAQDMGLVVNPLGATMQMEGCIIMGLGYVLTEEVRFRGGEISDVNFDTYEIPRFSWLPQIETVLVKNDELTPQGGGEPAIVPMGAAIANAVFDATGTRVFRLPITPDRLKKAAARQ